MVKGEALGFVLGDAGDEDVHVFNRCRTGHGYTPCPSRHEYLR